MKKVREIINQADYVLIGIGNEFEYKDIAEDLQKIYAEKKEHTQGYESEWILPFLRNFKHQNKRLDTIISAYNNLYDLVKDKNYFVVTLNEDDVIMKTKLNKDKITAPCGSISRIQCIQGCKDSITVAPELFERMVGDLKNPELSLKKIQKPVCRYCGKEMVINTIEQENYMEDGYIKSWELYRKWLTGTLNKKICLLELGVDFKYPSVIRWAFEKVAFINEKAVMIRVNEKYPQLTEELKGKAYSYDKNSLEFFGSV